LSDSSEKYLVCFKSNSSHPESVYIIIPLPQRSSFKPLNHTKLISRNSTLRTIILPQKMKLSPFFLWIFNTGKNILPRSFQKSDKHVLISWLVLLTIAFWIFLFLLYFIYHHKTNDKRQLSTSRSFIRFDKIPPHDHRTLFNVKLNCKNHKCLCQYRRCAHSTKSISSDLLRKQSVYIQPSLIEPNQWRYAKIKRISSTKKLDEDFLTGQFRTIVKLKSLPN
jgi:hypothetical protein